MKKKMLIEGMSCKHCVMHVKNALSELEGVEDVNVDLENKMATMKTEVCDEKLKKAIEDVGYEVAKIEKII